jgi:hypothetical protein
MGFLPDELGGPSGEAVSLITGGRRLELRRPPLLPSLGLILISKI